MSGALSESTFSDTGLSWSMARSSMDPLGDSISRSTYAMVIFHDVRDVYPEKLDLECSYSLTSCLTAQPTDRIGLYKLGESLPQNYIVSQFVTDTNKSVIKFKGSDLPEDDGEFYQLYYVSDREIRGASTPFQFRGGGQLTLSESTDEDDLVIVKYQPAADDTEDRIQALKQRCQMLEKRHHDSERQRELLMELHEKRNTELQEKQAEITDLNNQLTEIRKSQKRLCERVTGMEESTEKAQMEKTSALQEKQECESVIQELKLQTETLQKEKVQILQTREECEKLMSEMQSKLEGMEKDRVVKQQRSEKSKQLTAELQSKLDTVSQNYEERLKDMEGTMKQTVQQHHEVKVMLESEKKATQLELEEKRKKVTDLDRQILSLSLRNHENMLHIDTLQAKILKETMEKEKLCKQLKELLKDNENLRKERAELMKEDSSDEQELSQRVNVLTDHVSSLESRKRDLEAAMEDSIERRQHAQDELARLSLDITQLHTTNRNLREQKSLLEEECAYLKDFVKELQQRLKMSAQQFQNQYIIIHNLNKKIKKMESDKKARAAKEVEQAEEPRERREQSRSDTESLPSSKGLEEVEKRILEEIQQLTITSEDPRGTTIVRSHCTTATSRPMAASTSSIGSGVIKTKPISGDTLQKLLHTGTITTAPERTSAPSSLEGAAAAPPTSSLPYGVRIECPFCNFRVSLENRSEKEGTEEVTAHIKSEHGPRQTSSPVPEVFEERPSAPASMEVLEGAAAAPSSPSYGMNIECPFCDFRVSLKDKTVNKATEEVTVHIDNKHLPQKCPSCPLEFPPGDFESLERHVYVAHFSNDDPDNQSLRLSSWDLGID